MAKKTDANYNRNYYEKNRERILARKKEQRQAQMEVKKPLFRDNQFGQIEKHLEKDLGKISKTLEDRLTDIIDISTERATLQALGKLESDQALRLEKIEKNFEGLKQEVSNLENPENGGVKKVSKLENEEFQFPTLKLKNYIPTTIVAFMMCSLTSFLVIEQIDFYLLKQYSFERSLFYSLLMEFSLVSMSFFTGYLGKKGKKRLSKLTGIMTVITAITLGFLVKESVNKRALHVETMTPIEIKEKRTLEEALHTAKDPYLIGMEGVKQLPKDHVTDRENRLKELKALYGPGIEKAQAKLDNFNKRMIGKSMDGLSESNLMIWIRWLAILLNLSFAFLLPRMGAD